VLAGNAGTLGWLMGSLGAGGLIGGLLTASLGSVDRRGLVQLVSLLVHSLAHALFCVVAYRTHQLWLTLPFLVLAGTVESLHLTTNQTVLQLLAPDHLRGRLTSVLQLVQLINPIGIFAAGALADQGKLAEAIALLEKRSGEVRRVQEHHLRAWYALADLKERAGDLPGARSLFERVRTQDPQFADVAERLAALG
jgi:MFS family permease